LRRIVLADLENTPAGRHPPGGKAAGRWAFSRVPSRPRSLCLRDDGFTIAYGRPEARHDSISAGDARIRARSASEGVFRCADLAGASGS
jgi:hypothetical protein